MGVTYIHLVRHAQGFHNLSVENYQIPDPDLTPLGEEQCAQLQKNFPYHDNITYLVASPMRRTLRTCLLSFAPAVMKGKKIIALPELQEVSTAPCDIGTDAEVLAEQFKDEPVDFSLVKEGWNKKDRSSSWAPEVSKLEARAKAARIFLRDMASGAETNGEVHIVVVSHGGYIHFFTNDWDGMDPSKGTGWENTEYRTYEFVDPSGNDPNATLRETNPSWRRRRGSSIPLTEQEQMELRSLEAKRIQKELDEIDSVQKQKAV
jgi:broad specificity phosphatase PhoE